MKSKNVKPFVLVPGAWLGGWVWKRVAPLIQEKGYSAFPVTLTGMGDRVHLATKEVGVETAVRDVENVIEYEDLEDITLVGHSFAGKIVAAVADRMPERVNTILFLDAFRPRKNLGAPQGSFDPQEFGSFKQEEWRIPFTTEILDNIGRDVRGIDREWILSKSTPWPMKHAIEPVTLSKNFDSMKCAYIFCTAGGDPVDEILKGTWGKLDGPYRVIDSGHYPMITKPNELADDLVSLAFESV